MASGGEDDLCSLYQWLRGEDLLRGRIQLLDSPVRAGEMGAGPDAIVAAVGSGGALTVLARAIPAWLGQRRRSDVKVEVVIPGGRRVVVQAPARDAERLLRIALGGGEQGP
jgi:hypothetical protein